MTKRCVFLVAWALALCALRAEAQTKPTAFTNSFHLHFNFAPPGARATALGGSFIGLADDATAAAANPAGLTILVEPEVSAHLRLSGIHLEQPGLVMAENQTSQQRTVYPSFVSGVLPVRQGAVAVYYLEETHFKARFAEPRQGRADLGPFLDSTVATAFPGPITYRYTERENITLRQLGVAAGFKLGPTLSVGGSFRYAFADVNAQVIEDFDQAAVESRFGSFFTRTSTLVDTDSDVTFNLGVMFKPTNKFSVGGVYRQGADHKIVGTITDSFLNQTDVATLPARFAIPDSYGVGLAMRPSEHLTIAVDVARIEYGDLGAGIIGGNPIQNATEFHAGVEYVLLIGANALPVSLRGGFFTDPDHDEFEDIASGQSHGTAGVGVVLARRYQIDFGLNLSRDIKEGLLSVVVRF